MGAVEGGSPRAGWHNRPANRRQTGSVGSDNREERRGTCRAKEMAMRSVWRWVVALAVAWLAWAPLWLPAGAQSGSVAAEGYDVDLTVQDGGALAVVERLALDFSGGPFRHGYRDI